MNFATLLDRFFSDDKVMLSLVLVAVDIVLGVAAAWKAGNFRLSYVADFARNDIAFKLIPYFVIYAGAILTDEKALDIASDAFYAFITVAWLASIASSVMQLKEAPKGDQTLRTALASENAAPPKD